MTVSDGLSTFLSAFRFNSLRAAFCTQFLAFLALLAVAGCAGTTPPPPPPPPPDECPANSHPVDVLAAPVDSGPWADLFRDVNPGVKIDTDSVVCECDAGYALDEAGACVVVPPPPPPPTCGENERSEGAGCVCIQGHIRDPLGNCARPQNYIPWGDRADWARVVDLAYTVHRGDRDLQKILDRGACYLAGGSFEILDEDAAEMRALIATMAGVRDEGDRLIWRIKNEPHRFFDAGAPWLRSQVRKSRANEMIAALNAQTSIYGAISARFGDVAGCDAIGCKIDNKPCP